MSKRPPRTNPPELGSRGGRVKFKNLPHKATEEQLEAACRDLRSIMYERHPLSARFHEILEELGDLHDRKQIDYGRAKDPFFNLRASAGWGVKPWIGAMVRLNDKINRLQTFVNKGELANESAKDSLLDIAVYSIIALILLEEENGRDTID